MRYGFVTLLWCSLLIVLLGTTVSVNSAFAGTSTPGSAANQQFTIRGKAVFDGLWRFSYAPSNPSKRHLTYLLAYVDPGSGQLIWQMVVAACVGGLFYIKRVRGFLGRLVKKWFKKR